MRNYKHPMFQHRHYETVADTLKMVRPNEHWSPNKLMQWDMTVREFVRVFNTDNPKFSPDRFRKACGELFNV